MMQFLRPVGAAIVNALALQPTGSVLDIGQVKEGPYGQLQAAHGTGLLALPYSTLNIRGLPCFEEAIDEQRQDGPFCRNILPI